MRGGRIQKILSIARRHPLAFLRELVWRLSFHTVEFNIMYGFHCDQIKSAGGDFDGITVEEARTTDIESFPVPIERRSLLLGRLQSGDICLMAKGSEGIIGYEWFSTRPLYFEERYGYKIEIPDNAFYAYDAFVAEGHRGCGIWNRIIASSVELMRNQSRTRIISFIDFDNEGSIAAHQRVGFYPVKRVRYLKMFGRRIFKEQKILGAL